MAFQSMEDDPSWIYLKPSRDQQQESMSRPFDSKKNCWIPDAGEGYIAGEIKSSKGDMVTIWTVKSTEVTLKKDLVQEQNPPKFDKAEDMANLTFLNEASVLANLRDRYSCMMIYTYSGLFCVVINPYKRLPIYSQEVIKFYMGKRRNEMPPHLFAVSDEAYRNMEMDRENQSMLITGESGAGKTENTKKVISYFAIVGATQSGGAAPKEAKEGQKGGTLEEQIVQTNPVLEAFGNAKTVRNNNSSRFGKFIRTHFSRTGKLAGGDIEHYLLEKSRVVRQAPGERDFHIFYQIMSGHDKKLREKLRLDNELPYYHFCAQAELTIDGVNDAHEYRDTDMAFDIMGFDQSEKENMMHLVAGIMHMGEMKFKQRPREEQAEIDENVKDAENAAFNFACDHEAFLKSLVKPRVRVGTEWVNKGQNLEQVSWAVNGLGKAIYARMFKWLIERCNKTLDAKAIERKYFIGVLDIAGFEIFDFNSFEQLWINFVNERLQQFFNHHMFVLEQEEYQREGIHWEFIDFGLDLQACIELIEKPLGIISMLDEECIVPKATDLTLAQKLNDQHLGKHPNFRKPAPPKGKQGEAHMAIAHYAGTVRYNCLNWLEKNKDPLNDTAVSVLKTTKNNQLMLEIWQDYQTQEEALELQKASGGKEGGKKKGKSASFMTVSMIYRESLNKLMTMLYGTHPHFVRCIIPNEKKTAGLLDAALVLNQLTCNGVLEGIRICRKGFPNRLLYPDFKQRYTILAADAAKSSDDPVKSSQAILDVLLKDTIVREEDFKRGETKVFFKAGVLAKMEDARDQKLTWIMTGFQSHCRSYCKKINAKRRREMAAGQLIMQRNVRVWLELRTWPWFILYGKTLPLARQGKIQEQLDALAEKILELQGNIEKETSSKNDLSEILRKLEEEQNELREQMKLHAGDTAGMDEKVQKLQEQKDQLEKEVEESTQKLAALEDSNAALGKEKKKIEGDMDSLKKQIQDLELSLRKVDSEKGSKDHQIKSLQEEMANQDELVAKLNKEMKHQSEASKKLMEDLQAEEDKVNHLNKVKAKLDAQVESLEDALERERRLKQDADKAKRKADGELKVVNENIEELEKQRHDLEVNNKRKEGELHSSSSKLEDEQSMVAKLQKQIKELQARSQEIEEELEAERESHAKVDRSKNDIQREIEELSQRLEEAGGATGAQIEMNKKREAELARLRRDLEESNMNHESQLNNLRRKHNDAVAEMTDQIDQIQKAKGKTDKEKAQISREIQDITSLIDVEAKGKTDLDKSCKSLELQLAELQAKSDEQTRQLADFNMLKGRLHNENTDLQRQLEDVDSQISSLQHVKSQLNTQLEDAKRMADDESRERQSLGGTLKNIQHENDSLRDQLEEEGEAKAELQRHVSKLNAEIQQWKAKFDSEGLAKIEEIEEAKRKLMAKANELQESIDAANSKIVSLEKTRQKLIGDLDNAQVEVERANGYAFSLEKKQRNFEQMVDEWRKKCDDISAELDAVQRDNRGLSTECFKLKNTQDEMNEACESLRRENKNMSIEIKDLSDQLGEGGRSVHELQKMSRRLEVEKEELQHALDEAESALEAEESKVLRAQVEVSQIRSEIEKRIQEKEEEFENTRKNHQRALDSMQVTLESEVKGKQEALRVKKKLESDINELEIALDHANKANADAQKNIKKFQEQIRELQIHIDEEQRQKDDLREQFNNSERRSAVLSTEKDEMLVAAEQSDRSRRNAEIDAQEQREVANDLTGQNASLSAVKRKAEGELQALHTDLDESLNELKQADETGKKAMADAARLAEELRQEQEHATHIDRMRKGLEDAIKEMQIRLEEAEQAALKGGKKIIAKLEQRIRELEQELDSEQRRYQETDKGLRKTDRRIKELEFQVEEDKKNAERQQDLVEKLQTKIKTYKRQIDEAEEVAATNLAKYRQLQQQLDDAEERADMAENSLSKLRTKTRQSSSMAPGLMTSASAAGGLLRSPSRGRASASTSAMHFD